MPRPAAVALFLCLVAGCGDSTGPSSAAALRLAYVARPHAWGVDTIIRVAADGSGRTVLLAGTPERAFFGAMLASPDGQRLLVQAADQAYASFEWLLVPTAGGTPVVAEVPTNAWPMSWSRDGQHIAWRAIDGEFQRLCVAMAGASATTCLTPDSLVLDGPDAEFSPDGHQLVFAARTAGEWERNIYTVDLQGNLRQRTDSMGALSWPAWAPDGETIAFSRFDTDRNVSGVWLVPADGSALRELAPGVYSRLAYSPDGRTLSMEAIDLGGAAAVMEAGTGLITALPVAPRWQSPPFDRLPWSPDGSRLVVSVSGRGSSQTIATIRPDGTDLRYVVPDSARGLFPTWIPPSD